MFTTRYFAGDVHYGQPDIRETFKTILGAFRYPAQTYRWSQFLHGHTLLAELASASPGFVSKIHRPYVSTRYSCEERVDLLMRHYEIMLEAGLGHLIRHGLMRAIPISSFAGKSGAAYRVELSTFDPHNQAGELEFRLLLGDLRVYSVSFVLTTMNGLCHVRVGSLNGVLKTGNGIGIKEVTRDLHGCRPKDMMIALVREMGGVLGCANTILTGNGHKLPPAEKRYCRKAADYDLTWKDMHATQRADGDFELPCTLAASVATAAPQSAHGGSPATPTKRSALLDSIRLSLRNRLATERSAAALGLAPSFTSALRQNRADPPAW